MSKKKQPPATIDDAQAPLAVWLLVGLIVVASATAWYLKIGRQPSFESPELIPHYADKLAKFKRVRRGVNDPAWIVAIGRSDLDYALPEFNPYEKKTDGAFASDGSLLLQKLILFSAMLGDFQRLLPHVVSAEPDLILIDYDLLFEDATAYRNANHSLDYLRYLAKGSKGPFRPHGGSHPNFADHDRARCKESKYKNPRQITNLVQRLLHLQNLKQVRRSDGHSAQRAEAFFAAAADKGIRLAAVRLPVHPELHNQRQKLGLFERADELQKLKEWQERFGLQYVAVSQDWPAELFCDATHMSQAGKTRFWQEMQPQLQQLVAKAP